MEEAVFQQDMEVFNGEAEDNTEAIIQPTEGRLSPERDVVAGDDEERVDYDESPTERRRRENLVDVVSAFFHEKPCQDLYELD